MRLKKVLVVTIIIEAILSISLIKNSYEYYHTYNVWVEAEDKFTTPLIFLVVLLLLVVIPLVVLIMIAKRGTPKQPKREPDYLAIKKRSSSSIGSNIMVFLLVSLISKKFIYSIGIEHLSMDLSEAAYFAGHYEIFKEHFLAMSAVALISDVITFFIAHNCANKSIGISNNPMPNDVCDREEINTASKRKAIRRFFIIYVCVLLVLLLVVFVLLYIKTQPHYDMDKFMGKCSRCNRTSTSYVIKDGEKYCGNCAMAVYGLFTN